MIGPMTTAELCALAEKYAVAQDDLAAKAAEDFTHWHHAALAEILRRLIRLAPN